MEKRIIAATSHHAKEIDQNEDDAQDEGASNHTIEDDGVGETYSGRDAGHRLTSYGGGLRKQFVRFVPAMGSDAACFPSKVNGTARSSGHDISSFYLNLVLRESNESAPTPPQASETSSAPHPTLSTPPKNKNNDKAATMSEHAQSNPSPSPPNLIIAAPSLQPSDHSVNLIQAVKINQQTVSSPPSPASSQAYYFCEVCNIEIPLEEVRSHESTIAHQASQPHSDLPYHLDRRSEGFKQMVRMKWDPDQRKGLGPAGHGIRFPIKTKMKDDNLGIGAKCKETESETEGGAALQGQRRLKKTAHRALTAKEMRKLDQIEREKRQQLHEMFHRR